MKTCLHYLTITEAAEGIRSGSFSPVELTQVCLDRIASLNARLHAFIMVTAEQAMAKARQAEAEIRAGRLRGPLHGIPIAHKDIVCTRGVCTTAHSNLLRDWAPQEDATVYARLERAGAISLGKLALWEFAIGAPGPNAAFPPARNPWNTEYSPGGSSSGSGSALAAGLCFGATGTDTGASIRHPAAVCAIVGMKPTFGRVSVHGVLPLAASLDHVGPMTRSVRDNVLMLQAMAGYDTADPTSATEPVPDFQRLIGQSIRGLRLGIPRAFIASSPHEPECLAAFEAALRVFRDLGAHTADFDFPVLVRAADLGARILAAESNACHRENLAQSPDKFDVSARARLSLGAKQTPRELQEALAAREELNRGYAALFASGIDAILSPGREGISDTMEVLMSNPTARLGGSTRMYNMTGMPALVMPMGFGAHGMPLGLQIAAPRFAEDRVYQLAAAYEAATPWVSRHPAI